jgi:hypothetical protein
MDDAPRQLGVYLHLAQASLRRNRPLVRSRLLLLAAVAAANSHLPGVAGYCRRAILAQNPQHLIRQWPSVGQALLDDEFLQFLRQVRRRYPAEKAEQMLASLGMDMAHEREAYFSDVEYAAAILGVAVADLQLDD